MAGQISEADQIKQFKEFLGTYNKITENCFLDCIKDFTSREVKPEEDLRPWQHDAGKAEKHASPAFYSKHILWRRR
ncbi:mitochondrial import inner membrane translocase subunit Tim9 isoform X2 [Pezoporus wallicus]|uniref:mitochondrial import inner membrane translocase subunit Tim9 isoform X2 n=1 Tax=Pezoporus wallicus TaxID=35540 RepID=UPI00254FB4C3|nr:mitochondrial import inner membrane translocase subunit Tim9 isoform X2 [Pezoporus wallicus]XP_061318405.1 mitochondrial import inner membrane translocase subunit Tim9 isoform X2 [Pezoporus flaviventris]